MTRFALTLLGMVALGLSTGCCHWWSPCGPRGCGYSGGVGYAQPGCPTGNCGIPQGGQIVAPHTSQYHSPESFQGVHMGVPQPIEGPITTFPVGKPITTISPNEYPFAPPQVAAQPLDSLPTY